MTFSVTPRATAIHRIVILRALQLGDMLCAIPSVRALRKLFPAAEITLVGLPWAKELQCRFEKYIDSYIEFPGYPGLPERAFDLSDVASFLDEVRSRSFDLAVQLHGSGEIVNDLVASFGATRTAVLYSRSALVPQPELAALYRDDLSETDRLLELPRRLAPAFGVALEIDHTLEFPLRDEEREAATQVLSQQGAHGPIVTVHPGARDPKRRARPQAFLDAYRALPTTPRESSTVVITGSSFEMESVRAVIEAFQIDGVSRIVETASLDVPLGVLAALIERSEHLITNDTGASHLADALRIPSTVFFSNSDPNRWAPRDRQLHRVVDLRMQSQPESLLSQV